MYNFTNNPQQQKAIRILERALSRGLAVSISDGDGGWALRRSVSLPDCIAAIGEMDMDELVFRDAATGERVGWMMLVWEFGGEADELPADYTANETMEALATA